MKSDDLADLSKHKSSAGIAKSKTQQLLVLYQRLGPLGIYCIITSYMLDLGRPRPVPLGGHQVIRPLDKTLRIGSPERHSRTAT